MSSYVISSEALTSVAEAIRQKGGITQQLEFPAGFISEIEKLATSSKGRKIFKVSLSAPITTTATPIVLGDSDVAAHYNDTNALITVLRTDNLEADGVCSVFVGNRMYGSGLYGSRCNLSSGTAGGGAMTSPISEGAPSTMTVGCNADGDIVAKMSTGKNSLPVGDYTVTFSW